MAETSQKEAQEKEPASAPKAGTDIAEQVPVYNVNDGLVGRNGGPYLDEELAKEQEIRNARAEGREADFSNLAASPSPGVQLVTGPELIRASAGRIGDGGLTGEISAPVYGYVPNPALVVENQVRDQATAEAESAKVDPRSNVETPKGAKEPDNNHKEQTVPASSGKVGAATGNTR